MKLLTKTTLYFLLAMTLLLAASGFYLFSEFSKEINNRSDKELITDEIKWIQYLESEAENGTTFILKTPDLLIFPVDRPVSSFPTISDTYEYNPKLNNRIPYRQLSHVVSVSGIPYQITIKKSQEQKAVLVTNVTRTMLFVFIGLFVVMLIFNWILSKKLWEPFKQSLYKIRNAELQKMEAVHFEKTNIDEFNELNASLNYMTSKIYADYVNMKEFTENAAHEMQTPLAVVHSKLELLLQDSNLNEEQLQSIIQATTVLDRLSKLNQGLLLLAKIQNNQFETSEEISLMEVTQKYLNLFAEIIKDKHLIIEKHFQKDFKIKLHPLLADSLITNLLGNAIKYNYEGGRVEIVTTEDKFQISNTSLLKPLPPGSLFKRFNISKEAGESSNGLGLAIVKKIADAHNLQVAYHAENGMHRFTIEKNVL